MIEYKVEAIKNTGDRCITSDIVQRIVTHYGVNNYNLVSTSVLTDNHGTEILYLFFARKEQ